MTYSYNGNLTFEERVGLISKELINEYNLDKETAIKIAAIEEPITINNEDDSRYKRLYNIVRISDDEELKNRVLYDMLKYYENIKGSSEKIDRFISDIKSYMEYNTELPEYK